MELNKMNYYSVCFHFFSVYIRSQPEGSHIVSHKEAVLCCGYSQEFRQVVSCTEASVSTNELSETPVQSTHSSADVMRYCHALCVNSSVFDDALCVNSSVSDDLLCMNSSAFDDALCVNSPVSDDVLCENKAVYSETLKVSE